MPSVVVFIKHIPEIIYACFLGILEWIIPRSWYAKDVSNDIVLITGAGSGLGRELALQFARVGSSLVLWDIDQKGMDETKKLIDQEHKAFMRKSMNDNHNNHEARDKFCTTYIVDVSKRENVYNAAKIVHEDLNKDKSANDEAGEKYISILVNNAGIYHGVYLQDLSDTQIERIFNINILAHFWTVRAFLPKMIEYKRGHLLEIASYGGLNGGLKQVDYSATKFATVGFEESLSVELDHLGHGDYIKTTSVCPFFFQSNLLSGLDSNNIDIMSASHVAQEAVLSLRCNHARIILPGYAYIMRFLSSIINRQTLIAFTKALGIDVGMRQVKGRALAQGA